MSILNAAIAGALILMLVFMVLFVGPWLIALPARRRDRKIDKLRRRERQQARERLREKQGEEP
jgi:hypothetical protein